MNRNPNGSCMDAKKRANHLALLQITDLPRAHGAATNWVALHLPVSARVSVETTHMHCRNALPQEMCNFPTILKENEAYILLYPIKKKQTQVKHPTPPFSLTTSAPLSNLSLAPSVPSPFRVPPRCPPFSAHRAIANEHHLHPLWRTELSGSPAIGRPPRHRPGRMDQPSKTIQNPLVAGLPMFSYNTHIYRDVVPSIY